ncbi:MAG: phage holin family protein [Xanthomonadales bacterium]|nr:phage holin family protein [Xanthomonadales bacterium]
MLDEFLLLGHELRATASSQLRLAALETRQAGESLISIIAMGLIAAGLVFSTWLALVAAVMLALVERGLMTASAASLLAMAANMLVALILIVAIRRKSRRLLFSATVNSLAPPPPDTSKAGTGK